MTRTRFVHMLTRMGTDSFDPLAFDILLGLRQALRTERNWRRLRSADRVDKEAAEKEVAAAISEHLRLANWRLERGPPAVGGGHPRGKVP